MSDQEYKEAVGDETSEAMESFAILAEKQNEIKVKLQKIRANLSKTAKDRRTSSWKQKISDNVCALREECGTRHKLMIVREEFTGSDYEKEGVLEVVKETCLAVLNWVDKEVGMMEISTVPAVEHKMRRFYMDLVTGYLNQCEEQSEEDLCGLDYGFFMDRIETIYSKFLFHQESALKIENANVRQQLEAEGKALATRIQAYCLSSTKPRAASVSNTGTNNGFNHHHHQLPTGTTMPSTSPLTLEAVVSALTAAHTPKSDFRLPRMELLKFDGDSDKWREFKERFVALIHSKATLQPIEKMHYLKSCLTGEALDTVKNMSLTQYEEGWAAVLRRYQNRKILIYNALRKLLSLPAATERSTDVKRLMDSVKIIRFDLSELEVSIDEWNAIFVFIISERLPKDTFEAWEQSCVSKTVVQPLSSLEEFLENRIHTLQAIEKSYGSGKVKVHAAVAQVPVAASAVSTNQPPKKKSAPSVPSVGTEKLILKCKFCSGTHMNYKCPKLADLSPVDRKKLVEAHQLCVLCLNEHQVDTCKHSWRCRKCNEKHSSRLHVDVVSAQLCNSDGNVFLPSALVTIDSESGHQRLIRVLIDQGSMRNFVTESVAQSMRMARRPSNTVVVGIGGVETESNGISQFTFNSSIQPDLQFVVNAEVLPVVAKDLNELGTGLPDEFNDLVLADKFFWKGGTVDAVFGAALYSDILLTGMRKSTMLAQETHLGWMLSGRAHGAASSSRVRCFASITGNLDHLLQRFWETEEKIVSVPAWTKEQQEAEEFYSATTTRDETGRYVCRLPLKTDFSLGQSRGAALANMFKLEKRFEKDVGLKERYVASIDEYITLGHAEPVLMPPPPRHCYLPHLAVIKEDSLTTKTRVVFNASSPTSNKKSLNDNLLVGPVVQRDLEKKVLRFRMDKLVFSCDIEKMYRQIRMHSEDQDLQRFVWRASPTQPIQEFRLTTVTFGQASAPFTATRTLVQLAKDMKDEYPVAAKILLGETYVDDLHWGSKTVEELLTGYHQLTVTLESAGFCARKYSSNSNEFVNALPEEVINPNRSTKFLGIIWDVNQDHLKYPAVLLSSKPELTKRELLAEICSIFDPLGWVQPLVVPAKILMQSLWTLQLNWNDAVPEELLDKWQLIRSSLNQISEFTIPRWTSFQADQGADLHGFCDASERAYGAAVFIRTPAGVHLIVAKSRVAPLTHTTIPRLELMGAVLLADLMTRVITAFSDQKLQATCWCDSRVALHWIKGEPAKWKPFIRNRAVFIRQLISPDRWFYVKSAENPADLVSRGCEFGELQNNSLWRHGPSWLLDWVKDDAATVTSVSIDDLNMISAEELKRKVICAMVMEQDANVLSNLIERISSFYKVVRIIGWSIRFATRVRSNREQPSSLSLSLEEIDYAERLLVQHLQSLQFAEELVRLRSNQMIPRGSKLRSLSPFLDEHGILRVGGRLSRSELPFAEKHPIILSFIPILGSVIHHHHLAVCHGGPVLTLGNLRKRFWILNGTQVVKKYVRSCLVCHRFRPRLMQQMMAALPPPRISLSKAFFNTGVDFAGPVTLKAEVGRGSRNYKAYIAVFVCLATKAIHLEVIGSLSADSFLAALRRFVGRRGPVAHLYSDNGTNNVGVFRRLDAIQEKMQKESLKWSFIPPGAPHFGGLWEAGVKSMKTHLKKTLSTTTCTFEELSTVVVQVEAVLNARPLCPFSGDVEDVDALTPMHFLTGHQYVPLPEEDEAEGAQLTNRFAYLQSLFHNICHRYKEEYVTRLQQRPKWLGPKPAIAIGQLVLISDENLVSSKWPLGRVVNIHPGPDDITRVVTLLTKDGVKKRPIAKLSPLPLDHPNSILSDDEIEQLRAKFI